MGKDFKGIIGLTRIGSKMPGLCRTACVLAFSLSLLLVMVGCGASTPAVSPNPAPTLTGISPDSANAGAAAQTLTINGTNFMSSSTVTYKAVGHAATFAERDAANDCPDRR